jgi:ubiquinone/menaquinone biosynthesis C-methylase UbiE
VCLTIRESDSVHDGEICLVIPSPLIPSAVILGLMITDKERILEQYQNANNLSARIALHERFSTRKGVFHEWLFDHLKVPEQGRVLELGTGSAKLWQVNRERIPQGWTITLSDLSEGMLADAKKNVADIPHKFSFVQLDAQAISFDDASFDMVTANYMLYHVPDIDKALSEIRRVLKPDGRFYAGTGGLGHMKELDDFVEAHMAAKLPGVFERMDSVTGHFALENGAEKLGRHFASVKLHLPPESHLHVTEAEPFMAYILSMARWSALTKDVSKETVDEVVREARKIVEEKLPIHLTTSAGLFEAW